MRAGQRGARKVRDVTEEQKEKPEPWKETPGVEEIAEGQ